MLKRPLLIVAAVGALAFTAGPASATDNPAPGVQPGACVDNLLPSSHFTAKAARRAGRKRLLRGTAKDTGCGLNRVRISVVRRHAGKCRSLTRKKRLGHRTSCHKRHWLPVRGTAKWSFRLPKKLHEGKYMVRTRAVDFAGNVEHAHGRHIRLR